MRVQETKQSVVLEVHVKPRSRDFRIEVEEDEIVVFCKEKLVKGKANKELIKEFSRLFNRQVKLVSGFTSEQKNLLIKNAEKSKVKRVLLRK